MLRGDREFTKQLSLRKIINVRINPLDETRSFATPIIYFNARDYWELINWQSSKLLESPLTRRTITEDLQCKVNRGTVSPWSIMNLPYHNQAIDRKVKIITETAFAVFWLC